MPTPTQLGITLPTVSSPPNGPEQMMDIATKISANLIKTFPTVVSLPAAGNWAGRLGFVEEDKTLRVWDGSKWVAQGPEPWITPTLAAGVSHTAGATPVRYRRNQGVVEFEGTVSGSAGSGYTLFTFEPGYLPVGNCAFWASAGTYVAVSATGVVTSTITGVKSGVAFSGQFRNGGA